MFTHTPRDERPDRQWFVERSRKSEADLAYELEIDKRIMKDIGFELRNGRWERIQDEEK
jgi:hypothetical protein